MDMPDNVTQILIEHRNSIWSAAVTLFFGANGGLIAVLMADPPMKKREAYTTVFIGAMMAIGFGSTAGIIMGVPFGKSLSITGTALFAGLLGKPLARYILKLGDKV